MQCYVHWNQVINCYKLCKAFEKQIDYLIKSTWSDSCYWFRDEDRRLERNCKIRKTKEEKK